MNAAMLLIDAWLFLSVVLVSWRLSRLYELFFTQRWLYDRMNNNEKSHHWEHVLVSVILGVALLGLTITTGAHIFIDMSLEHTAQDWVSFVEPLCWVLFLVGCDKTLHHLIKEEEYKAVYNYYIDRGYDETE